MNLQRSEIYFVNLNPVEGKEQAGKRPVLILSSNRINCLINKVVVKCDCTTNLGSLVPPLDNFYSATRSH